MRNNPTQLPSIKELEEILKKEAKREISSSKHDVHFPEFSVIKKFLVSLDIETDFFDQQLIPDKLNEQTIENVNRMINLVIERSTGIKKEIADEVYGYLSGEDVLEKADLLFVFGSKGNYRIDKAIELWRKEYAPKLFISGSKPHYDKSSENEAEALKKYAIEKGLPKENIMTESESITLPDNVKRSLNILDGFSEFQRVILVNSPYSQRRGWCHFMKFSSEKYAFIRVNADTKDDLKRGHWYKNEVGLRLYFNEFVKMKVAVMLNSA